MKKFKIKNILINNKKYYKFEDKFMSVLSLVIELSNGNVAKVIWENGCFSCSGDNCFIEPVYKTYKNCI